MQTSPQTTLTN